MPAGCDEKCIPCDWVNENNCNIRAFRKGAASIPWAGRPFASFGFVALGVEKAPPFIYLSIRQASAGKAPGLPIL
jgi:hypothetical protein